MRNRKRALSLLLCFAMLSGIILPALQVVVPFARAEGEVTVGEGETAEGGSDSVYTLDPDTEVTEGEVPAVPTESVPPSESIPPVESVEPEESEKPEESAEPIKAVRPLRAPAAFSAVKAAAVDPDATSWDNGDLVGQGLCNTNDGKHSFLSAPFSYAYFYQGTDPEDTRAAGFYEMVLSNAGNQDWPKGFYACSPNADSGTGNQLATLHQAAANAPSYHYSPGLAFTAPRDGKVEFVYQYAGLDATNSQFTFYVMRGSASDYSGALYSYQATKAVASGSDGGQYDEVTLEIEVSQGEVIYFVTDSTGNGSMCAHWIKSARYMAESTPDGEYGDLTEHCGNANNHKFYADDAPIGYAFYYQGTDPDDSRSAGFYEMQLSTNNDGWSHGYYNCALNSGETGNLARISTIQQASPCAPSYHYSPGFVYTAPETGMVEFVYQYAGLDNPPMGSTSKFTFYIMRESAAEYEDALYSYKPEKSVSSGDGSGSYDAATIKLNVTEGERIYFVADNAENGHMVAHWIKSAKYVEDTPTYTLTTDKASYTEGEAITVTSTVSDGGFSSKDTIQILKAGSSAVMEKTAAGTVVFEPAAAQLPAGNYQVSLIRGGKAVQTKNITVTPDPNATSWDNGNLVGQGLCNTDEGKHRFYTAGTPFGYAFYYQGTDPEDSRSAGFYDMVLAEAGDQDWPKGFYACGLNGSEIKDGKIDNRLATLHQAAANAPSYHYSPGIVFTAPKTGLVEFVYQYAGLDAALEKFDFHIMRESATGYGDALYSYKATKAVSSSSDTGSYDEVTLKLNVTQGEKVYFVVDSPDGGGMTAHWIKSAKYLENSPTYTLATDKASYAEGEAITVTSSVSEGGFSAADTIKITPAGGTPALSLAAAATVKFLPTAVQLPAGSYQVALVHGGLAVATAEITVTNSTPPEPATSWDNGELIDHYKNNRSFYDAGTPFGYAFYYEGTNAGEDDRQKGFYDMQLSTHSDGWISGFYTCGKTPGDAPSTWVNTIHQAAANAPSYHYSPGMVFTAPVAGMVEFTYQFAKAYGGGGCDNHVVRILRDVADPYEKGAIATFTPSAVLTGEGDGASGTPETQTIIVNVTQGEKIYFVIDNHDGNGGMSAHWIKAARYVEETPTYTLTTDRTDYIEGEAIQVTATVSKGGFSATDTVKIIPANSTQATMTLPAAGTVTFSPSAQELPAGSYQITLVHGGIAKATAEITVTSSVPPQPGTSWDNGDIMEHYKNNRSFYAAESPFGYAFYYEGTNPDDSRSKGFYEMLLSTNSDGWLNGFYGCGTTADEAGTVWGGTIHQAAANAPSYHYSPGMVFTAPKTGTVEFTYQFAKAYGGGGCDNHVVRVLRDVPDPYEKGAIVTFTPTAVLSGEGEGASGTPETQIFTVSVNEGEKLYFVIDNHNANGGMSAHWIKAARYLDAEPAYSLVTDKNEYSAGETISVTATVANTRFDCTDRVKIRSGADNSVVMDVALAANGAATITPTAQQLPGGDYRVTLEHGGREVATRSISVAAPEITETEWENGDLTEKVVSSEQKKSFYGANTPFGYAFFYEGTDPEDTRLSGFYNMVLATAGVPDWPNGFYACGLTGSEVKDGKNDNRLSTLQQAASCAPTYHYSPGIVFTAPHTGTVKFIYQYAGLDGVLDKFTIYVMRDSATTYAQAIASYKPTKAVSSSGQRMRSAAEDSPYNIAELEVPVTKGEKIYFVVDQNITEGGGMVTHWIQSATYTEVKPAYSLSLKESYTEGETVTVTTKVTDGQLAAGDTLKLIFKDDGAAVMEQAAAGTVNFAPTAGKTLAAGDYRAVLFHDGKEVASKAFRVVNSEVPTTQVWEFGDLVAHYKNPRTFYSVYDQHSPVGYAFFYEGTDENDTRRKGFYNMVLSENGDDWSNGNYFCAANKTAVKDGKNDPQIATIHQAASCAPTFHYSPGFVFTAPKAGTVEFTYQFAKAFGGGGCDSHVIRVMREGMRSYQSSIVDYTLTSTLSDDMNNPGTPTTKTLYVEMDEGEKLYFIVDNDGGNGGMTAHWIKSIRYVDQETAERNQEAIEKPVIKPEEPYVRYDSPTGEDWNNGDLPSFAKDKWKFYDQFSPFGYAFFYEGTDPQDPRLGGFHDMILAKAGETDWPKGFYACGLDDREVKDEVIDNRLNALHQAGATAPTYHYSPGIVFTAPYTGTVLFIYQYAGLDKLDDKFTFYVMREDAKTYADALYAEKPTKIIHSADGSGDYDEMRFAVKMRRGEKLYFVNDSTDNGDMCIHCIKAAGYLSISPTYALETNKTRYVEGESIKITTRVWDGELGEGDMVRISPAGRVKVSMELPAGRTVAFDPAENQLPAGNYQVALICDGETVASQNITVVGETVPDGSFWDNGDMPPNCKFKKNFYGEDTPFGYAFYYEGTDPEDPRSAGFYDMILSTAGDIDWPNGFYACGLAADEVKDGKIDNRLNTLHQAAANAPTYHYSPGIVFTASYTGVVDIVYQYAGLDGVEDKFTFYVMRDSAKSYEDALYSYKPTKSVNSAGGFGKYDEVNLKLEVRKGEKIYFVTDSTGNGHMCAHWIKSAGYVTIAPTYILTSDKDSYGEGEPITVTTSVSEGEFSVGDMIRIIPEGAKQAVMELPVSAAATFTPAEDQIPTGSSRIVLIHEGKEVASKRILIVGETVSTGTSWENGGLPEHCTEAGKRNFYAPETPFSYAFFYEGTDPEDFRLAGFYDMILSTAGDIDWPNGFYACGLSADEVKDGKIDNRLNTLHQAAANGPTYHYSPGVAFTAPFTGTVKFVYQYAGLDSVEEKFTFYVMRDSARSYDEALYSYKPTKAVSSVDGGGGYDEATLELDVTKGEKIYFVTDNMENGHMCAHWIASAAYTSIVSSYTLDTDKVRYAEGDTITATATVSDGEFGAGDVIRVISTAGEQVAMELPAGETVSFTPALGQIPAGNYRVALVHGGEEVAAKAVRIIAADAPFDGFWDNGDMLEHGKYKHDFYGTDTPFSYAFFYEGRRQANRGGVLGK